MRKKVFIILMIWISLPSIILSLFTGFSEVRASGMNDVRERDRTLVLPKLSRSLNRSSYSAAKLDSVDQFYIIVALGYEKQRITAEAQYNYVIKEMMVKHLVRCLYLKIVMELQQNLTSYLQKHAGYKYSSLVVIKLAGKFIRYPSLFGSNLIHSSIKFN